MKKSIWIHVGLIVGMLVVATVYMSPSLSGKGIEQGDMIKFESMANMQRLSAEQTGHRPNWAPGMFGGMPGYQITKDPQHSVFQPLVDIFNLTFLHHSNDIGVIFLYLLGFYVAMLAFGLSPWLAAVAALGFGLGSYNIIIIEAGHLTKAWAMALMAPTLAGMVLTLRSAIYPTTDDKRRQRRQVLWGILLFTLALILQLSYNHIQITYYTAIACVVAGVAYFVAAVVAKRLPQAAAVVGLLVIGAALAFGCNARLLLVNEEYARYTMRGGNELTITPADLYGQTEQTASQNTTNGLDIDYAYSWSYGIGETYTLLVPGAMGGGSTEKVSHNSAFYKTFHQERAPLYWGNQPFTSGPVYFGAIVMLLALLGMIITRGPERWWLLAVGIVGMMLSWGRNFMGFNEWVFNHMPLYNKFRTPSMALVITNMCAVILAALAAKAVFDPKRNRKQINLGLYISTAVLAVVILGVIIASSAFSYSGLSDRQMAVQYGQQWDMIYSVLSADRAALLKADSLRSLLFIVLAAAALWLYNNNKLRNSGVAIALLGVLITVDLWGVDRRYLSADNFKDKRKLELRRDKWDYDIDALAAQYGDHDYRVLNLAVNTFNDSKPSAFHCQIGGYSAAKLSRYQNLIDFYLQRHISPQVLAMLNTRYVVLQDGSVQRLPDALGNAWFVQDIKWVHGADEEILALANNNPATTAIIDADRYGSVANASLGIDSAATIALEPQRIFNPDYIKYNSHSNADQLAVFSEIHYQPDWFAYIDGKPAQYVRANYVLRAMVVPAGNHVIEFRNEAPRLHKLDNITLVISILTLLVMAGAVVLVYRKPKAAKQ